jgi:DNA polymerase III epsilon subunit-like protein
VNSTYAWPGTRTVALDLETTGLNRERDRIIQYGMFGTHDISCTAVVDAETPTGRDPQNIPCVSRMDVKRARPLRDGHLDVLYDALHGSVVVMHNAAHDWAFIKNEFYRHQRPAPTPTLCVCTYSWARRAKLTGSLTLGDLCERFNISLDTAHHAWHDARATFYLYITWLNRLYDSRPPDHIVLEWRSVYFHNPMLKTETPSTNNL